MVHLVRITNKDYKYYRRSYAKIEYSFRLKDEPQMLISKEQKQFTDAAILKKGEFLDELEKPGVEMYFVKDEQEEIVGIITIYAEAKRAYINMFAVFEKGKGIGTEAYNVLKEMFIERKIKLVRLLCPFNGARVFWVKQGFYLVNRCDHKDITYETWL